MTNKRDFWQWYVETSKTAGSLVTPSSASRMIGTSRAYIDKLASTGKITKYYFHEGGIDLPFIGMNDINEIIAKRKKKIEQENDPNILELKARIEQTIEEIEKERNRKYEEQKEAESEEMPDEFAFAQAEKYQEILDNLEDILEKEKNSEEFTDFNAEEWKEKIEE